MPLSVWQVDPIHLTPYYNLTLCAALAQVGCDVHYATSTFIYDSALPNPVDVQIHRLYFPQTDQLTFLRPSSLRRMLRMLLYPLGHYRLLQALDEQPPSIVHLQWTRLPRLDRWLIEQLHQCNIPVVYTAHDIEPLFSTAVDLFEIYAAVDIIIVHTPANRDFLLRRYPKLSKKIRVIPHLAPTWEIPPSASRAEARVRIGLSADAPVVLFFGSNRPYKGLDLLVESFKRAKLVRRDLQLVVAGHLDDSDLLSALREAQVWVEPAYVPSDQLWLYHLAADVVVFPYRQISQSGELITAMSFGLPVIVTDVGGMPETVSGNGWVVPPNDPVVLSEAILDAFSDMPRLKARGLQSAQLICSDYSPALVAEQMLKLYREIIQCYSASSTVPTV